MEQLFRKLWSPQPDLKYKIEGVYDLLRWRQFDYLDANGWLKLFQCLDLGRCDLAWGYYNNPASKLEQAVVFGKIQLMVDDSTFELVHLSDVVDNTIKYLYSSLGVAELKSGLYAKNQVYFYYLMPTSKAKYRYLHNQLMHHIYNYRSRTVVSRPVD